MRSGARRGSGTRYGGLVLQDVVIGRYFRGRNNILEYKAFPARPTAPRPGGGDHAAVTQHDKPLQRVTALTTRTAARSEPLPALQRHQVHIHEVRSANPGRMQMARECLATFEAKAHMQVGYPIFNLTNSAQFREAVFR